jgi:hypothetical protein
MGSAMRSAAKLVTMGSRRRRLAHQVFGPVVLPKGGAIRSFDRPLVALTTALDDPDGAAIHVAEFTPGARVPLFLQQLASLAAPGQVLLSRAAFDLARDAADVSADGLVWLAHGPYLFDGMREPTDVFEVGRPGTSLLRPPPDTTQARRAVRPGDEATLGWRPAPGLAVPARDGWTFVDKLGEGGYGEVWLAAHPCGERRVIKFCFDASRVRGLKRDATLFRILKEELGDRDDIAKVLDWNFDDPPFFWNRNTRTVGISQSGDTLRAASVPCRCRRGSSSSRKSPRRWPPRIRWASSTRT